MAAASSASEPVERQKAHEDECWHGALQVLGEPWGEGPEQTAKGVSIGGGEEQVQMGRAS